MRNNDAPARAAAGAADDVSGAETGSARAPLEFVESNVSAPALHGAEPDLSVLVLRR
jgi:hypothetical protein